MHSSPVLHRRFPSHADSDGCISAHLAIVSSSFTPQDAYAGLVAVGCCGGAVLGLAVPLPRTWNAAETQGPRHLDLTPNALFMATGLPPQVVDW